MELMTPLAQTGRRSLGEQVYEAIREQIVSLRLEPGGMIYENEQAAALGVSRTPIREAIRLLVSEGLIEVLPQRGTRIAAISPRRVQEARFVREQLELGAFCLAARLWRETDRSAVKRMLDGQLAGQEEAAERGDAEQFLRLDEAFHRTVLEVAGNATLIGVIYQQRGHLNRVRMLAMREFHSFAELVGEHRQLLAAIEAGDEELVRSLLRRHVGKLEAELQSLEEKYPQYFVR